MLLAPLVIAALVGCRGRAQREVYEAKMTHEIRVLEDQLYEADYHNRVLIDKLEQVRLKSAPAPKSDVRGSRSYDVSPRTVPSGVPSGTGSRDTIPEPIRDPVPDATPSLTPQESPELDPDAASGIGAIVDEGQPADPSEVLPPSAQDPFSDDPNGSERKIGDETRPMETDESGGLLPAPGGPEPPSKRDTEIPPVLPGEILPPSILDGEQDKPPGQILLPDSVQDGAGVPDQLRLHPSLSGGRRVDGKLENMLIVVNVLDAHGRPLDLTEFNVDAELSVVMYEVDQDETDESRIGRWDFSADQVQEMVKADPISGLHVPIQWQERQPEGEEVVIHVRLRAEGDEMRCDGRLKVERANAVAEWTPRGELLK